MSGIFLGPVRFWLLWLLLLVALYLCGTYVLHVREFVSFIFIVLGLAVGTVLFVLLSHKNGERVTREPFDDD